MMLYIVNSTWFFFVYPVLLLLSVLAGARAARHYYHKKSIIWKPIGIEGSVISIFGLILSFTLSTSNSEYRVRTNDMNLETDVAAQMRRQSLFMSDDVRARVKSYLIGYTGTYMIINNDGWKNEQILDSVGKVNDDFVNYLLSIHMDSSKNAEDVNTLLKYHNNLCTHFYKNVFSYGERTPGIVVVLLIVGSLLIGLLIGFMNAFSVGYKSFLIPAIYIFLTSLAIIAILDMDSPKTGFIKPDIRNMEYFHNVLQNSNR